MEHPAVNVSAFHLVPCPLGTGNDLARSLGWGHRFPGMDGLPRFVAAAQHARLGPCLDVWRVHFNATVRERHAARDLCMTTLLTSPLNTTGAQAAPDAELFLHRR